MSSLRKLAVLATTALAATTSAVAEESENQCGLYLAPSSTQESEETTVWGLYAGKEIPTGQVIGPTELAINLWHFKANSVVTEEDSADAQHSEALQAMVDFAESYIWVPSPVGARFEQEEGRVVSAVPGAGVLSAFDMKLTNANWLHHNAYRQPAWNNQPGVPHAGRGAFTPFYQATIEATADIAAGSEIFMDYGENWAEEEKREALLLEDYKNLDATINKMIAFFEKHDDLHESSKAEIYKFLTKDVLTAAMGNFKAKTAAKLLPETPEELKEIPAKGGILVHSAPTVYRQMKWLEQNGFCVDYLKPGPSTIPEAGRGALASRPVKAGTVLTASPLVHIPDKAIFDLHPVVLDESDGEYMRSSDEVVGQQLFINYCYGHPSSSMVFFPSGPMASYINHSKEKANAKLQWSKREQHHSSWFDKDPMELMEEEYLFLGLVMEVVATRDIAEGEEVFIDYGDSWQAAWDKHVSEWKAPAEWPLRAIDYMAQYEKKPFETVQDLGKTPTYPDHVELKAFLMIEESLRSGSRDDPKFWSMPEDGTAYDADNLFDMVIEEKREVDGEEEGEKTWEYLIRWSNNRGVETFVDHVPHDAIIFVDAPGKSDQYVVEKPFRHYIGIPDDVFPKGPWRNLE